MRDAPQQPPATLWALARLILPGMEPELRCTVCGAAALLHFRAESPDDHSALPRQQENADPAPARPAVNSDLYACPTHAGESAITAVFIAAVGRAGPM